MTCHFDPDTLSINLAAIDADADCRARALLARYPDATYQVEFDGARARYLDVAQGHVAARQFARDQAALQARMTPSERKIFVLREAAHLAPMIDDTSRAIAEQEQAERQLAELVAGRK